MWINQGQAADYRLQIQDQELRCLVTYCWEVILTTADEPEGEFDVLYFTKIMEKVFNDKQALRDVLEGRYKPHPMSEGESLE